MTIKRFYIRGAAKRRGGILPARLRFSAHRGVTLVELMIAMLILALVCTSWLEIIGIQSARKEARRREAVERLAGMMDAFMYVYKTGKSSETGDNIASSCYEMLMEENRIYFRSDTSKKKIYSLFDRDKSPIGYQLRVVDSSDSLVKDVMLNWGTKKWLVGLLYNHSGSVGDPGIGEPFFCLPIHLGL